MERKPVIGVTPYKRKEEPFDLYIPAGIIAAVERLGGEVRLLDYEKLRAYELIGEVVQLDGVIFAGGPDVDPSLYGEEKVPGCGEIIRRRDDMELNLFPLLLTRGLPILGICRGCQVINVAFGGTLVQDIPTTYHVSHRQEKDGAPFSHNVLITAGTMLHRIIGKTVLATNSYHHQCVKELAPGLIPNAYAAEGFIEGFEGAPDGPFLLAVQWHPEVTLDDDEDSIKPFAAFMDAVRAYMAVPCHG